MPWAHTQTNNNNELSYDDILHCWFYIKVHCSTLPFLFIKLSSSLHVHFHFRPLYSSKRHTFSNCIWCHLWWETCIAVIGRLASCSVWRWSKHKQGVCCWTSSHEVREKNINKCCSIISSLFTSMQLLNIHSAIFADVWGTHICLHCHHLRQSNWAPILKDRHHIIKPWKGRYSY